MKSHPSIFRCEFAPGHRTLKHPFVLTRKKLVAVAVFLSVAGLLGGAQGSPASRIEDLTKEVAAVRPLACDAGNPRGNSTYKTALVGAVIDLRAAIQSRIDEIQKNAGITEDERQSILVKYKAIVSSIDAAVPPASAADMTKAILNVCAFMPAATMPGTPPPAPAPLTLSIRAVDFGDLEVYGDPGEQNILVSNDNDKTGYQLTIVPPKDPDGQKLSADFQLETKGTDSEPCGEVLKAKTHCRVYVRFAPTTAGPKANKVEITVKGVKDDGTPDDRVPSFLNTSVTLSGAGHVNDIVSVTSASSNAPHPAFRSVVGLDISGASSADTQAKYFVEFDLNVPIGFSGAVCVKDSPLGANRANAQKTCDSGKHAEQRIDPLNQRFWAFFNPRITSLPQSPTPLSTLNIQGFSDFLTNVQNKTDLVQGIEVQGGFEIMLLKPRSGIPIWGSYKNTHAQLGVAFTTGVGFTTPFSALKSNPTVFVLPGLSTPPLPSDPRIRFSNCTTIDPVTKLPCPIPASFTDIAFVNMDRSRFFRKWYAGLRFKTYHFSDRAAGQCDPGYGRPCEATHNGFPGIVDLTAGQDEQATGGHLSNIVLRVDAVYPLPFLPGANVFGSVVSAFKKNNVSNPLILAPDATTPITSPSVFVVPVGQPFRDTFRIGVGFDLIQVLNFRRAAGNGNQQAAPVPVPDSAPPKGQAKQPPKVPTPVPAQAPAPTPAQAPAAAPTPARVPQSGATTNN